MTAGFDPRLVPVAERRHAARRPAPKEKPKPKEKPAPTHETGIARILRTKTLRIAGSLDSAPYSDKDPKSGAWRGLFPALGASLADALGVKLDIVEANPSYLLPALQQGTIDLCFGLGPTAGRALSVDFSRPLFDDPIVVVTRPGLAPRRWDELDTPQTRIAVANGTAEDRAARELVDAATITGFRTVQDAIAAVQSGRSDCVVAAVLRAIAALHADLSLGWLVVPRPQARLPVCAAFAYDEDRRLRAVVNAWGEEGSGNGRTLHLILAALEALGIKPDAVPPGVTFQA